MLDKNRITQFSALESHAVLGLLALQFVLTPLIPFAPRFFLGFAVHAGYQLLLVALVVNVSRHRVQVALCIALVAISTLIRATELVPTGIRASCANAASIGALILVLTLSIRRFFASKKVTPATISGAIAIYLLAGLPFTLTYVILSDLAGPAFRTPDGGMPSPVDLHYLSYTTMTTLGYGDYTPASPIARSVVLAQAVFGQMFIAVLIGRLVAIQVTCSLAEKGTQPRESTSNKHD